MKPKIKLKTRSQKGTVFVELALVIPLLIFIVLATFEVARAYHIQNTLYYGAKEAARIGASFREGVDGNFMSNGTVPRSQLENLIINSIRVRGVIEEPGQFMIRYLNMAGNEVNGVQDLPFDRQNNPGAIDFVEVQIQYPGTGSGVSTPIPAVLDPGKICGSGMIFPDGGLALMARAVFKIEGRFDN